MYLLNYQYNHDIDWFCKVLEYPVHLASNGGRLPRLSYTINELVELQHMVANMNQSFRCVVNTRYLEDYLQQGRYYEGIDELSEEEFRMMLPEQFEISEEIRNLSRPVLLYAWSFIEMAKRGFFSFDRKDGDGNEYHLVAWPDRLDLEDFSQDVYERLTGYDACCFPPRHQDFRIYLPDYITFNANSFSAFYQRN
jgi:hypothetical protein